MFAELGRLQIDPGEMYGGVQVHVVVIPSLEIAQQVLIGYPQRHLVSEAAVSLIDQKAEQIFSGKQEKEERNRPQRGPVHQPGWQKGDFPAYGTGIELGNKKQAGKEADVEDADHQIFADQDHRFSSFRGIQDRYGIFYDLLQTAQLVLIFRNANAK